MINKLASTTEWAIFPSTYVMTEVRPPNWSSYCTNYATYDSVNEVYVPVTGTPAWTANTYYFVPGNAYPIFTPSVELKMEHTNLAGSSTGWTESGVNVIDWIRRDIAKIDLSYSAMEAAELQYMYDLLDGKEFYVRYLDRGMTKRMSAYCGEVNYTFYHYGDSHDKDLYTECAMHIIQTYRAL